MSVVGIKRVERKIETEMELIMKSVNNSEDSWLESDIEASS